MHPNVVRLFKDIGIEYGVLMLSGFYLNGVLYVYDIDIIINICLSCCLCFSAFHIIALIII